MTKSHKDLIKQRQLDRKSLLVKKGIYKHLLRSTDEPWASTKEPIERNKVSILLP